MRNLSLKSRRKQKKDVSDLDLAKDIKESLDKDEIDTVTLLRVKSLYKILYSRIVRYSGSTQHACPCCGGTVTSEDYF